ncbi:MAG: hypothetical protein H6741_27705 [Alphaproteobacteria bacterium]|nr:hypothetical protein [Alphaproteobacteria bacterium]
MTAPAGRAAALAALMLGGCAPLPADYFATREACGLAEGEHLPSFYSYGLGLLRPLSAGCVAQLGADVGLDWYDWDTEPAELREKDDELEGVLAGLFMLIAADVGTLGELLDDPDTPTWVRDEALDLAELVGLSDDDDAGAFWYAYVTSRTKEVRFKQKEGSAAYYTGRAHRITLSEWTRQEDSDGSITTSNALLGHSPGSILVHEVAHLTQPGHVRCTWWEDDQSRWCDEDPEGANGVEIYYETQWTRHLDLSEPAHRALCEESEHLVDCDWIEDTTGFAPCEPPITCAR